MGSARTVGNKKVAMILTTNAKEKKSPVNFKAVCGSSLDPKSGGQKHQKKVHHKPLRRKVKSTTGALTTRRVSDTKKKNETSI